MKKSKRPPTARLTYCFPRCPPNSVSKNLETPQCPHINLRLPEKMLALPLLSRCDYSYPIIEQFFQENSRQLGEELN
jgi:hypothetical protein